MTPAETVFRTAYALADGPPVSKTFGGKIMVWASAKARVRWFDDELTAMAWIVSTTPDLADLLESQLDGLLKARPDIAAIVGQ